MKEGRIYSEGNSEMFPSLFERTRNVKGGVSFLSKPLQY